jgi:hypothetical protein
VKHWVKAKYLDGRGGIAVFLSRFIPVLHSLIPLTVGMSAMRYRNFMAWTVPACILWAFAYVSVGTFAAGSYRELSTKLHLAGFIFVGILVVFIGVVIVTKKLIARREASCTKRHTTPEPVDATDRSRRARLKGRREHDQTRGATRGCANRWMCSR